MSQLHSKVVGSLVKAGMHSDRSNNLGMCDASLVVGLHLGGQRSQQERLGTSRCRGSARALRAMEKSQNHSNNLRLHLSDTREDIGMKLVRHCELGECLGLQVCELLTSVVDSSTYTTLFPEGSLHIVVLRHLSDDLCVGHTFSRESPKDLGAGHSDDNVVLDLLNHNPCLLVNLSLDEGNVENLFGHFSGMETECVLKSISKDGVNKRKEVAKGCENDAELVYTWLGCSSSSFPDQIT